MQDALFVKNRRLHKIDAYYALINDPHQREKYYCCDPYFAHQISVDRIYYEKCSRYHEPNYYYEQEVSTLVKPDNQEIQRFGNLENAGDYYFSIGKYRRAISYYELAVYNLSKLKQTNYELIEKLGISFFNNKQYQKSIKYFNRLIEDRLKPNYLKMRARAFEELRDYTNALKDYQRCLKIIDDEYVLKKIIKYEDLVNQQSEKLSEENIIEETARLSTEATDNYPVEKPSSKPVIKKPIISTPDKPKKRKISFFIRLKKLFHKKKYHDENIDNMIFYIRNGDLSSAYEENNMFQKKKKK